MRYPTEITAIRYTGDNEWEIAEWAMGNTAPCTLIHENDQLLLCLPAETPQPVPYGAWIVLEHDGAMHLIDSPLFPDMAASDSNQLNIGWWLDGTVES